MKEHGLFTTQADYWAHLFPLLQPRRMLFWYRPADCILYIQDNKLEPTNGHSKDGSVTGLGYLIPQAAPFVRRCRVPDRYFDEKDFAKMNHRKAGFTGQAIVAEFRSDDGKSVRVVNTREAQFEKVYDLIIDGRLIEVKTECKTTANLFVQIAEGGHKPLIGGEYMPLPPFEDE